MISLVLSYDAVSPSPPCLVPECLFFGSTPFSEVLFDDDDEQDSFIQFDESRFFKPYLQEMRRLSRGSTLKSQKCIQGEHSGRTWCEI